MKNYLKFHVAQAFFHSQFAASKKNVNLRYANQLPGFSLSTETRFTNAPRKYIPIRHSKNILESTLQIKRPKAAEIINSFISKDTVYL